MSNQPKISALVINLDSAKERWKFQQEQLEYLDIPYQRWKATAVQDLTDREYEKWANDWQRKLRQTEVACFLSHYRAWQHVANSEKPFLILEDDALLSQQLPNILSLLDTEQNLEYDHLTLETRGRKKLISQNTCDNFESVAMHKLFLDKTGAAAYLLTSNGAQILIDEVEKKGAGLADALLCHTKGLKKVQSVPALAIQMDMAEHYGLDGLKLNSAAKSNISNPSNIKPSSNGIIKTLKYKSRRISTQLGMGINQLRNSSDGCYQEIVTNNDSFNYLYRLING